MEGHDIVVKDLLQAGADVNIQTYDGWTAFPAACQKGHNKVVSNFLEAGVDLNIQTENGSPALYAACQEGQEETAKILLRAGADLNIQTLGGWTSLAVACQEGHEEVVKTLVLAGADLYLQANNGCTSLWIASHGGHIKCVEVLIIAGATVDVQNENGWTALHVACQKGNDEVVKALLRAGADPNIQTSDGHAALWIAIFEGHVNCIGLLTNAGGIQEEDIKSTDHLQTQSQQLKEFIFQTACELLSFEETWKLAYGTQVLSAQYYSEEKEVLPKLDLLDKFFESNPNPLSKIMETMSRERRKVLADMVEEHKLEDTSTHILKRQHLAVSLKAAENMAGLLLKLIENAKTTAKEMGYNILEEGLAHEVEVIKRHELSLASNVRHLQESHTDFTLEDQNSRQEPDLTTKQSSQPCLVAKRRQFPKGIDLRTKEQQSHETCNLELSEEPVRGTIVHTSSMWPLQIPRSASESTHCLDSRHSYGHDGRVRSSDQLQFDSKSRSMSLPRDFMEKSPLSCIKQHSSPVSSIAEDIDFTGGTGDSGLGTGESDRTAWIYKTPASSQTVDTPPPLPPRDLADIGLSKRKQEMYNRN